MANTSVSTNHNFSLQATFLPIRRKWMTVWMLLGDMLALAISGLLAVNLRVWLKMDFSNPEQYINLYPLLFAFPLSYYRGGLYPGVGIRPYDELRRLTGSTCVVFAILAILTFLTQEGMSYSRLIFLMFWVFALVLVPTMRIISRRSGSLLGIWGEPVAIIGFGPQGQKILEYLSKNRSCGIIPAVIVDGVENRGRICQGEKSLMEIAASDLAVDKHLLSRMGIQTAILAPTEVPTVLRDSIVDEGAYGLRRVILISSLNWVGGSAVVPYDLQGLLGLEVQRNLLNPGERFSKRIIDLMIVSLGGVILLPLFLLLALCIHIDSVGPVFYQQKRLGRNGKVIRVWKFRTMIQSADQVLADYLNKNPELKEEWEENHKLKDDPRITRFGEFLRKTSLDELPQIWNVLKGEMSLVGPRPIVEDEIKHYANSYRFYTQVSPGITGLWQVSGRSDTSYEYRVSLDEYYIRHWSIWLDIYILFRTFWVVVKRNGAY